MSEQPDALPQYEYHSGAALMARLAKKWQPPEALKLSEWAEKTIVLPEEQRARPGEYRNWPYMREILDVMGDTQHERVTILKSARIGYTAGLIIAIGGIATNDPSQILLLMPTDEDATEIAVDTVEPIFESTPDLKGLLRRDRTGRNNTRNRQFVGGGSLKIRSGRAPRKLRRIDVQYLIIDEADGIEITKEGDAISLAEKRTLAKQRRKIIKGSTPVEEDVSVVYRDFLAGDQRIFEVPCPHKDCGERSEIVWEDIKYVCDDTTGLLKDVWWQCPKCKQRVDERYKPSMIQQGKFRALQPHITDHASFRINALSSLLPQATWWKICAEWLKAKREGIASIQVFTNTILGRPWKTSLNRVDAQTLMGRAEAIGKPSPLEVARDVRDFVIPPEVLAITAGTDVQDMRLETTIVGWTIDRAPVYLGHEVFEGNTLQADVWKQLDSWHRDFVERHPAGWQMKIDAMAVDSGGREGRTQVIYDWCAERLGRGIYAIKGDDGPNRKAWQKAKKVKGAVSLYIVGTDQLKTQVLDGFGRVPQNLETGEIDPHAARFSNSLEESWFEQATNEVRRLKLVQGRPVIEFKPKKEGAAVEALDCAVYAAAVTHSAYFMRVDFKARAARRPHAITNEQIQAVKDGLPIPPRASAEDKPARSKRSKIADMVARLQKGGQT